MAGGHVKYRHLSRKSSHRKALLRNLVASLFEHESIRTTWPKAKEAQRFAEKLITLGKKNTNGSRNAAWRHFYVCIEQYHPFFICAYGGFEQEPEKYIPKLFGELRLRYANRPGGYTRVLRIEPSKEDQDREDGEEKLELLARRLEKLDVDVEPVQKIVYPDAEKRLKPKKARWTLN